ncbi:hypothetical protein ACI79J_08925 [Geodermatophilus sp. SYSU D01062]
MRRRPSSTLRRATWAGAGLLVLASCTAHATDRSAVVLHVYDSSGNRLDWRQFRQLQSNGHGEDGYDDALLDPVTLEVTESGPLYPRRGDPALDQPDGEALLSLAWPSSDGYSQLLLPVPPAGTHNFNLLAAQQAVSAVHRQLSGQAGAPLPGDVEAAIVTARAELREAQDADTESGAAVAASRAYDAAVHAQVLLLQHAGAERCGQLRRAVTLDVFPTEAELRRAAAVVGSGGWVRFVLDLDVPLSDYAAAVRAAHRHDLRVLAQPVDSSEMAGLSDAAWRRRITDAVAALPDADEWEVGNEVNGDWLGPDVAARVAWAVRHVHARTSAPAMVTLFWQLGEAEPENALFNWLATHPEAVAEADDVGLSIYPEMHPLGAATDVVLRRLHAVVPHATLLVSELGYHSPDLEPIWWWGDREDPAGAGRAAVARLYTTAIAAYPFGGGGPFWWYFAAEATPGAPLTEALGSCWS